MKKKHVQDSLTSSEKRNNSKARKKWLKIAPLMMCGVMGTMAIGQTTASAHGYIENSRAHMGSKAKNEIGYDAALEKYGNIINDIQSLEAPKGFPLAGPADGQIASAGHAEFGKMDMQNPLYWDKVDINSGINTFVWNYTAEHPVAKWTYYITKQGWDPSKPLSRDELEEITTIDGGNQNPKEIPNNGGYVHKVDVPSDREGYHVILGVWDVANTANAFYQVMDVNIHNDGEVEPDTEAPTIVTKLQAEAKSTKVNLKWDASTDNVGVSHYNVYRNGEKLAPVTGTELEDVNLEVETEYTYEVSAVDRAGNESAKSMPLTVKTEKAPEVDTEAPTAPTGLHSMGVTAKTVDLMWTASTDNVEVDHYEVYRDGERVHTNVTDTRLNDTGLQPDTSYTYTVKAVDAAGNVSEASNTLNVKTIEGSTEEGATTWDPFAAYKKGDIVEYEGKKYVALQDYQGNGDPNWINAPSLWEEIK